MYTTYQNTWNGFTGKKINVNLKMATRNIEKKIENIETVKKRRLRSNRPQEDWRWSVAIGAIGQWQYKVGEGRGLGFREEMWEKIIIHLKKVPSKKCQEEVLSHFSALK